MVYKVIPACGYSVLEAPVIPKAPRSNRRNRGKKLVEEEHPCSFEILAAVAGKLLEESEGSASCNAAVEEKTKFQEKEDELPRADKSFKLGSMDRGSCAESKRKYIAAPLNCIIEDGSEVLSRNGKYEDVTGSLVNTNLVTSESSVKPLYRKLIPRAFLQKHWNNVKLGLRDNGENFIDCNNFSARIRPFGSQSRLGQHRMRKIVSSRYWKAALKRKTDNPCTASERTKAFYGYKKCVYPRERYQQTPIKKRRLSDRRFSAAYVCDGDTTRISISSVRGKDEIVAYTKSSLKPKEHHVTLSIKSFKVPELYLEMPESATVGSLKRNVLEAFNALLGGGTRVGMYFQGRKIRDDNRTLQQAGISQFTSLDSLAFALEPSLTHISSANREPFPVSPVCFADQNTPRFLANPLMGASGILNGVVEPQTVIKLESMDAKDLIQFPTTETCYDTSLALIPVSPMLVEAPLNQQPKCSGASQRRTRRPFSATEVEALVEAVEKLGTGRWREVKMLAFETADHRTYVDLKDKWKTLVHTASIAPQQRRGEPVPHELLDRVLAAHNSSKQHKKPLSIEPLRTVDSNEEMVAVVA